MENKIVDELMSYMPKMLKVFTRQHNDVLFKGTVTVPQLVFMQSVFEKGMSTMTDIAKAMGVTKAAATGLADRLIKSKLITRSRGIKDRRIVLISLTEKSKILLKKFIEDRKKIVKRAFSMLSKDEQVTYLKLARKVFTGLMKNE